jgi:hypothetical protein
VRVSLFARCFGGLASHRYSAGRGVQPRSVVDGAAGNQGEAETCGGISRALTRPGARSLFGRFAALRSDIILRFVKLVKYFTNFYGTREVAYPRTR